MKTNFKLKNQSIAFVYAMLVAVLLSSCVMERTYKVEITYCDSRPKKIIFVTQMEKPDNYMIDTWKMAVPKYRGELNVCNIRVIE